MARPYPSTTRTTDADRAEVLAHLDSAYADGQLRSEEHALRTGLLADARTFADLDALVEDLQGVSAPRPANPVRPAKRPNPGTRRQRFAAGTVIAALAAAVAGFALTHDDDDTAAAAEPAAAPVASDLDALPPRVIATPDLWTAEGFTQFVEDYRAMFGDTVVDNLYLGDDHGSFTRAVPREPNRAIEYYYRYGFEADDGPTSRDVTTPTVDLATVDVAALGRVLSDATTRLNVPDGEVTSLSIGHDSRGGGPEIDIVVANEFDESGYLTLTPAGDVVHVRPFGE